MNRLLIKGGLLAAAIIASLIYLYPNVLWYSLPLEKRQEQAKRKDPRAKQVIPLGLDLQGGVHLVYQLDVSKLPDESAETITRAIEQNMVVINNRVDALGVANPNVFRQGREFIVIQLPGVYGSEDARSIIGKTALLEFRLVKDDPALVRILEEIQKRNLPSEAVTQGRLPEDIAKLVPEGLQLLPFREGGFKLVEAKPALTGQYLRQARVELGHANQVGGMSIGFELNADGAQLFEAFTGAHIGEQLAIVLDNIIQSSPVIQSRIPGGRGQITGTFTPQDAKLIANVLNSGNLQAPMTVVEERTVGPELGEDSIRSGFRAMAIGFALVVIFVVIFYKLSGLMADFALILNLLFLMAIMASIRANMTLPGIAGIILSLAMAVDANVIILERVKDELKKGKDPKTAIHEGYDKAFSAILDGNLTTILAAMFLFQFGTGPVKGFAVTLMWGLGISMVTAVWVTRYFYELWFAVSRPKTLSV